MLESGIQNLKTYPKPWWFIIFPEGTRFNAVKRDANQQVMKGR
jgi:1-acyl-sn-glycerol-3-phosphate acyltransferase